MWRSPSSSAITRSFSVTIPTQRFASFTTGTPCSSCSPRSRATSSALVSGLTVAGSSSMYSRTVGIGALTLPSERRRESVDHVARNDVVGPSDLTRRMHARVRVHEHARRRGFEGAEALAEQRADHTAQHVAGAGRGERRRGAGADRGGPLSGLGDDRVVALQQDDGPAPPRRLARVVEPPPPDLARVDLEQPAELARVRREDGR